MNDDRDDREHGDDHGETTRRLIPCTYAEVPPGYSEDDASYAELRAAGFHGGEPAERKAGTAPAAERIVEGSQTISVDDASAILAESRFLVIRDPAGKIVATWDEGRWWTPDESDTFTRMIVEGLQSQ